MNTEEPGTPPIHRFFTEGDMRMIGMALAPHAPHHVLHQIHMATLALRARKLQLKGRTT